MFPVERVVVAKELGAVLVHAGHQADAPLLARPRAHLGRALDSPGDPPRR